MKSTGWELLSGRADQSRDYGTQIHALFEAIEWLEDFGRDWETALVEHWDTKRPIADPEIRAKAHAEVLTCLRELEIQHWFSREAQGGEKATVWRERAFDVMLKGEWVSGVFDRVVFPSVRGS